MRMHHLILAALFAGTAACSRPEPRSWEELSRTYECPEWFRDARFGLWAHWGAQAQPEKGGGWYARNMYMTDVGGETWGADAYAYHCHTYGHPSEVGYKDVLNEWKAERLDADAVMEYAEQLGARYFVILANHHDHFDNFDSTHHPWNSVDVGPHRDIVGEFERAARRRGMRFGVSSHDDRFLGWWLPAFGHDETGPYAGVPYDGHMTREDGAGKWWEGLDPADLYGLPPAQRTPEWEEGVKRNWLDRHTELITKYDVDLLWFDGYGFPYDDYGQELSRRFYNRLLERKGSIDGAVIGKIDDQPATIKDVESGTANGILPEVWQGTLSPNEWFYKKDEQPMRHSARTIIEMLADMNSKNGNLLLNLTLAPDGTIPPEHKAILDEVGAWVNLNAEAIYGSRPWKVYGDNLGSMLAVLKSKKHPTETDLEQIERLEEDSEQFNQRTVESPAFGHDEVRFTTHDGHLYIIVLNPEEGPIRLPSLGLAAATAPARVARIEMVGGGEPLDFSQDDRALTFRVPAERPNAYATVFRTTFE